MWRRDAGHWLHHPAEPDQAHARSHPQTGHSLSISPAPPARRGPHRLRDGSAPAWSAERGAKGELSAGRLSDGCLEARYLFSTHIGWEKGERRRWEVDPARREQSLEDRYVIPAESPLLGLYAGADISYGKFVKTIHDQHLLYRGDWADPIRLR